MEMPIVLNNEEVIGEKGGSLREGVGLGGKARLQKTEELMGGEELLTMKFIVWE